MTGLLHKIYFHLLKFRKMFQLVERRQQPRCKPELRQGQGSMSQFLGADNLKKIEHVFVCFVVQARIWDNLLFIF